MKSPERRFRALAADAGLTVLDIRVKGSGHYHAQVQAPDGRIRTAVFPCTPSDWRGERNRRAELRRFARGA